MRFNDHWNLKDKHAFLSPSNYHWVNDSEEKLISRYHNYKAKERGSRLHELAKDCIELGVKMPKNKNVFNLYVNDAIGFKMTPEQTLYYSAYCFGTADSISFRKNTLRIHDLKTGTVPASIVQLEVYAALFCLEYGFAPSDISMELRIYQEPEVYVHVPDPSSIREIMDTIIIFDKKLQDLSDELD